MVAAMSVGAIALSDDRRGVLVTATGRFWWLSSAENDKIISANR
jgi:hypothetical protein